jgi:putative ABC transport system permease protein
MAAVWARCRAELRTRWRSWVGLALLLGLAGGVVLALVAGARRTDTAYDRLVAGERPANLKVQVGGLADAGVGNPLSILERLGRLPGVTEHGLFAQFTADPGDNSSFTSDSYFDTVAPVDQGAERFAARWKLVAGRRANPARADEALVGFTVAEQYGLRPGSRLRLRLFSQEEAAALYQDGTLARLPRPSEGRLVGLRVAGVVAPADDFPPRVGVAVGTVLCTPAFARAFTDRYANDGWLSVRLAGGDASRRFAAETKRLTGTPLEELTDSDQSERALTRRALRLPALALEALAVLAAAAALVVAGQALARQGFLEAADNPRLRALGMTAGQLWAVAMARATLVALAGTGVAVAVAAALSGLFPIGLAATAEPHPGPVADAGQLAAGAAGFLAATLALAVGPAWRAHRLGDGAGPPARPSALAGILAGAGVPAPGVVGVRLALEPGWGRTALPVRTTALGAAVAVATLAAALTMGASVDHFLRSPRLYGWNWDLVVGDGAGPDLGPRLDRLLAAVPAEQASAGTLAVLQVGADGPIAITWATEPLRGSIAPTVIEGRPPAGPDEILLGAKTMEAAGARVGDQVEVRLRLLGWQPLQGSARSRRLRVVGRGVLPLESGSVGEGAAMTYDGLTRLTRGPARPPRNLLLLRWAPGVDRTRAAAGLTAEVPHLIRPQQPADVANYGRVQHLPLLLAGLVAAVATAMLAHVLVTSVRRRRRDLAVLKTLGFVRGQVSLTVAWQATTLLALALLVGLPVGVAAGRWLWTLFATRIYVLPEPVVPMAGILLLVPAAVLAANLVAAVPAWMAARTHPATVLRAE